MPRTRKPRAVEMSTLVALTQPERPTLVGHNRISHAAHYMYDDPRKGHDLDRWVVQSATQPTLEQVIALGVATDAKYHSGFVHNGKQHWIYTAIRPLSEGVACPTCDAASSQRLWAQRGLS